MSTATDGVELTDINLFKHSNDDLVDEEEESLLSTAEDIAADDDEIDDDILGEHILDDMKQALYDARYLAPIMALVALVISYFVTVYPYKINAHQIDRALSPIESLHLVRPILSVQQQKMIQKATLEAETHFSSVPSPHDSSIVSLRARTSGNDVVYNPPDLFFNGVIFGLTTEDSYDIEYTSQCKSDLIDMTQSFMAMNPQPTAILYRSVDLKINKANVTETGLGVYYSFDDLKKQGKFSSDRLQPWKRIQEDVLNIAREYKQVYITAWYPYEWASNVNDAEIDPNKYKNILQVTIPTRTGLEHISSSTVVWMTKMNLTTIEAVTAPPKVYRKAWTVDDHWSDYLYNEEDRVRERQKFMSEIASSSTSSDTSSSYKSSYR